MEPLQASRCAICDTAGEAVELYPASFDAWALSPAVFSARRLPDRVHLRMVRCRNCGLVRADPVLRAELAAALYARSSFDYDAEVQNLRWTYGRYLRRLAGLAARRGSLLEIGCGNGFFLEEALAQGYAEVRGVEPSQAAVARAAPAVRPFITCEMMRPGLFPAQHFDAVCLFHLLDHAHDPAGLLDECFRVTRPGGLVLTVVHNLEAVSARLLGRRSPIVDIEHTFLYSPRTLARLFRRSGFLVRRQGSVLNRYSLYYLAWMAPLPAPVKGPLLEQLRRRTLARLPLWLPLGNMYLIAQRPRPPGPPG
jgi:SAM-dependent methyltransferase